MKRNQPILFLLVLMLATACGPKRHFVVSKVRSAAKLSTTETHIDKLVVGTKTKTFLKLVRISEANFVASTKAIVTTGIDLNKLSSEDIKTEGKMIDIRFPPIEVLDFRYPFDSFKVDKNITKSAFLNQLGIEDYEDFYRQAELDIRENLQYTGIIDQSKKNTERMMRGLLSNLGYEEIYISFKETKNLFPPVNLSKEEEND